MPLVETVDLDAPGYYFLATDTPGILRWLAAKAEHLGVGLRLGQPYRSARRIESGFDLGALGTTRFLVGADGPQSRVAKTHGLGLNRRFLAGVEHEIPNAVIPAHDRLHCFVDRRLAPGYIAWMLQGVDAVQIGVALRLGKHRLVAKDHMQRLLEKLSPVVDLRDRRPRSLRAGLIPWGGLVPKPAAQRVLLVGDAAGMVSPVTAGGIHTALAHGMAAGHAIADYLSGEHPDAIPQIVQSYPRFRFKRALRFAFDHLQSDALFNLLLATAPMRTTASMLYFHRR